MNIKGLLKQGQFKFDKNKGLIFTILSGAFEVAALVVMAKQAVKADKVLTPANKQIENLRKDLNNQEAIANKIIDPEIKKKEIKSIQKDTFIKLAKIYAAPVILAGLSLTFMGSSYKVMRDKQIALGAAYITLENAFKSYRDRVREQLGKDAENDIYRDMKEVERKTTRTNPKTGEEEELTEVIRRAQGGGAWDIFFDASSLAWEKNGRTNFETLMSLQKQANIQLRDHHYLFLYDVLMMLEIPEGCISKDMLIASKAVGWIYDPYDPERSSWVSFGISDEMGNANEVGKTLFNNEEKDCWLSFNPDGNILLDTCGKSFVHYIRG